MKNAKDETEQLMLEWEIKTHYMSMYKFHGNNRTPKSWITDYLNGDHK